MKHMIGEPRVVEAGRGAAWWSEGFRIFTSNMGTWMVILIVYVIITTLISIVPFIGTVGHWLLTPVFMGGLMIGCQAIERGEPLRVAHLFEGFQGVHFVPLMIIGAVNIALVLGMLALALGSFLGGFSLMEAARMGATSDPFGAFMGSARAITGTGLLVALLFLVILAVFAMLNWFAPSLVALRGATAVEAMKLSFLSSLRNWVPFLIYSIVGIAVVVAVLLVMGGLALLLGASALMGDSAGWGALLGVILLFFAAIAIIVLVVGPTVYGSIYASYKDTLAASDDALGNPAYQ